VSTRSRIIAAQAVLVGVLVVVVFATILRPETQEPLVGVSTPGGETPPTAVPAPGADEEGDGGGGGNGGTGGRPGNGGPGDGHGGVAPPTTVPQPGAPPALPPPADDESSPTDDQYADTLAKLEARLY
jgi:hypothetical protein